MSQTKKIIAVFFGGRSPEHDVSVVSGLQVLGAIDPSRYDSFPVYVTPSGEWLVGDVLRERSHYMLSAENKKKTQSVTLDMDASTPPQLLPKAGGFLSKPKPIAFDVALPVFHGEGGENGAVQGLFDFANVPYTGVRGMASNIFMDKVTTKRIQNDLDIPHLPYAVIERPSTGLFIAAQKLEPMLEGVTFPAIVKPVHLGSSIGVAKVENLDELSACLPPIFELDSAAIVEPFVQNLVEYNAAVARIDGVTRISAIERPKATDELLDFKQKYLSGGDGPNKLSGTKAPGTISEGMLSLTRELNPELDAKTKDNIAAWAARIFDALDAGGAPRIDFMMNEKSGDIWMNEINPIPGSYGYFLWEAAADSLLFGELLTHLIEEAVQIHKARSLPKDPVPKDARLFKR